jgi:hypothetical protein
VGVVGAGEQRPPLSPGAEPGGGVQACPKGLICASLNELVWTNGRGGSDGGTGLPRGLEGLKDCLVTTSLDRPEPTTNFIDVLKGWGHTWLWDDLKATGGTSWIAKAIAEGMLLVVADGSYICEQHPDLCAAAFILECTRHRGMLVGSFPEASKAANAFQGELLGLMAIHLLLLAVNTVSPRLAGRVKIYLDCLGALGHTAELPPYRIPTRCKHSDVLKMILVNCGCLLFHWEYIHIDAHQDDLKQWEDLLREAQLNAACDAGAKATLRL